MKRLVMTLALGLMVAACSSGPPEPPPPPPFTPAGSFDVSMNVMGMELAGTMTIEETDGMYSGSLDTPQGPLALTNFAVDGMEVTCVGDAGQFTIAFALTFEGDGFTGAMDLGDIGGGTITGTKR
ncbi:MAG: hypothetical protein VX815_16120 [Gemmatimonadota bacterium]|nr:hypothetical protein [Gemmatimonadota bacterium]